MTSITTVIPATSGASFPTTVFPTHVARSVSVIGTSTSTEAGTIKLQACNQHTGNPATYPDSSAVWVDVANATASIASATPFIIPKTDICYQFMRVVYTHSGGSGTVSAIVNVLSWV